MKQDVIGDKSALVRVVAWGRQTASVTCTDAAPVLWLHMVSLSHNEWTTPDFFLVGEIWI